MVAVVAEALVDAPCPRVGLTITGLGVGDSVVSVWRTADGERNPVRGARRTTLVESAFVTDYDAPVGRPITYEVEVIDGPDGASRTASEPVTVDSDTAWLMDPLVPQSAIPIRATRDADGAPYLRGNSLAEFEYAADVSLINVMGSTTPMALFGQVMKPRGVPLSMSTRSAEQNKQLKNLLTSTAQLLYRQPPSYGIDVPGVMFISVASKKELPVDVGWGGSLTWWEMTADTVAAPVLKVLTATFTYGDVAILFATYQQKQDAAAGKTYLDDLKSPFG
jgi:hypothetical protein